MNLLRARLLSYFLVVFLALSLVGCAANVPEGTKNIENSMSKSTNGSEKSNNEFEIIRQVSDKFLKNNKVKLITARELYERVILTGDKSFHIVDIRGGSHFAEAHIPGSINIPYGETWKELKTEFLPRDKKIVLVCYSGHTSSQTAAFWGMLGFDVVVLKNGMAGWSKYEQFIGSTPLACEPFDFPLVSDVVKEQSFSLPVIKEGITDPTSLIRKRSENYLKGNFSPVILAKDVKERIVDGIEGNNFYLVDIRTLEHYQTGHIAGSINIPLKTVAEIDSLKKLPTDKKIIVIGYDGHDASQVVRILVQLGYNATAMKDGIRIWNGNEQVTGIQGINCANVKNLPTDKLNYKPKTDSAPATCSG
ncbi:MAG: sulfur-carrier protein adenylyltransferase/sulfurtransferase [Clostridia bacterium]|jgi:rhodanese-related sulfurtransferase|nr:sulfur-carrier protein adenylyltransferase/sulfurtransferase [Clostridia bacterium]MDN5323495.1 sulfur-carrier protein adenylyltransferase/sulfurtransferase [Clostridia bacterium]